MEEKVLVLPETKEQATEFLKLAKDIASQYDVFNVQGSNELILKSKLSVTEWKNIVRLIQLLSTTDWNRLYQLVVMTSKGKSEFKDNLEAIKSMMSTETVQVSLTSLTLAAFNEIPVEGEIMELSVDEGIIEKLIKRIEKLEEWKTKMTGGKE